MATSEEKQELVDHLSGPRYYHITINGYGGEAAYINLSKAAFEFWHPIVEEHGDTDIVHYMVEAQDVEGEHYDFEVIESVPPEADFMKEDNYYYTWYEAPNEIVHQYGVEYGSSYITVDEVNSGEYNSTYVADVVDSADFQEYLDSTMESANWEIDLVESDEDFGEQGEYILQFYSSEKGCFFDGIIETVGNFDPKKLKVVVTEYPNGEDVVTSIEYDGVEIDNNGGDTNGKGYYVSLWKN